MNECELYRLLDLALGLFMSSLSASPAQTVHVFDDDGNFITRVNLETIQPMDVTKISKKMIEVIRELQGKGRF